MKRLLIIVLICYSSFLNSQPCLPNGIWFKMQEEIDSFQVNYPDCTEIEGDVLIGNWEPTDITNLDGLFDITSIGGSLGFEQNWVLTNLSGLNNLTSIGGGLMIGNWEHPNPALVSLEGLESLNVVGGYVYIESNAINSLTGLNNLTSIGGDFRISINSELMSLEGLEELISIGGTIEILYNNALVTLTGLDNINPGTINSLLIGSNPLLSTCHIQSICDYLAYPNSIVDIHNNSIGCNSPEEVEEACLTGVNEPEKANESLVVNPNPTKNKLKVESKKFKVKGTKYIHIYNSQGLKVKEIKVPDGIESMEIDVFKYTNGLYFLQYIRSNLIVETVKFIKN